MDQSTQEMALEMAALLQEIVMCCQMKDTNHATRFQVSTSECRTLRVFMEEDNLTMKALSNKMNLAMSRMTRIIDGLVKKDLVERASDERDRRICLVRLTQAGRKLVNEMENNYMTMNLEVLNSVTPQARPEVLKALKKLVTAMQKRRTSC